MNVTMSDDGDQRPLIYMPSPGQQIYLSLIAIPMSILSIIGSYFIIRHAKTGKGNSVYRQIMMVASACDIIWSVTWILQPFLSDTSTEFQHEDEIWIWAFGNTASCNFLGAMTQFGLSAHWFSGLISFYFLLTVKFQVKQTTFAKALPFLLGFIIAWSIGTAIAGVVMKRFHPLGPTPGCWVGGDGFCQGDDCDTTVLLGWIIGGIPTLLMLICVIVNNLILYCHVRRTVAEGQRRALEAQMEISKYSTIRVDGSGKGSTGRSSGKKSSKSREVQASGESKDSSLRSGISISDSSIESIVSGKSQKSFLSRFGRSDASVFSTGLSASPYKNSILRSSKKQWKRVQEVGRQSFLYVGEYLLSFGWTFIINYLDSKNFEYKENNAGNFFLPLLVLQSLGLPTMGFFNCCVYFRPKVLTVSKEFPNESRIWWVRRAIYGNAIKPTPASVAPPSEQPPVTLRINFGGEVPMSSLAPGDSDVDGSKNISAFEVSYKDCSVIMEAEYESSRNLEISYRSQQRDKLEVSHRSQPRDKAREARECLKEESSENE